jgi:hypothetical protein
MAKRLTLVAMFLASTQSACIVIGRSSRGGWFVWPGGFGLIILILILYFLFGRR